MKKQDRIKQIIQLCKEADKNKNLLHRVFYEIEYQYLRMLLKLNI